MAKSECLWKTGRCWKVKSKMTRKWGRWSEEGVPEEEFTWYEIEKQEGAEIGRLEKG